MTISYHIKLGNTHLGVAELSLLAGRERDRFPNSSPACDMQASPNGACPAK